MSEQNGASETQLPPWPDALTEREHEIVRLVGQDFSNKEIAYRLSIADSTVRHHLTNIFDKVGVSNRQKLLVHAHQLCATPVWNPSQNSVTTIVLHASGTTPGSWWRRNSRSRGAVVATGARQRRV